MFKQLGCLGRVLIVHHLSGSTQRGLQRGAWIQGIVAKSEHLPACRGILVLVPANSCFPCFVLPGENQAWPADDSLSENLAHILIRGTQLWSFFALQLSTQKIPQQRHQARRRNLWKWPCRAQNITLSNQWAINKPSLGNALQLPISTIYNPGKVLGAVKERSH